MQKRNIVVVGASAGGFQAIKQFISALPADLDAAIFIVWHMSPDVKGVMPQVLNRLRTLTAHNARDNEPIRTGQIYIAPPDHHLQVEKDVVRITRGPKENRFRPAVDPLFRSAAYAFGARVIGIILSGALDDGTAGLWTVKQYGGIAIVQDPNDAEVPSMPENALRSVPVDYILPVAKMAEVVISLVREEVSETKPPATKHDERVQTEINIAMEHQDLDHKIFEFGELSPYTCPECHGVLTSLVEGGRMRFRCHTGHAFSADSLIASVTESIEESLWSAIRNIQESVMLLNHMGDHFAEVNQPKLAAMYFQKATEANNRANIVRQAVMSHEQLSIDSIQQQAEQTG